MHAYLCVFMHIYVYIHVFVLHVLSYARIYVQVCQNTRISPYAYVFMRIYVFIHVYTRIWLPRGSCARIGIGMPLYAYIGIGMPLYAHNPLCMSIYAYIHEFVSFMCMFMY